LSDHFGLYFRDLGLDTECVVGVDGALAAARRSAPDVVICDYDLLATTQSVTGSATQCCRASPSWR
jgi:hypothetical protein